MRGKLFDKCLEDIHGIIILLFHNKCHAKSIEQQSHGAMIGHLRNQLLDLLGIELFDAFFQFVPSNLLLFARCVDQCLVTVMRGFEMGIAGIKGIRDDRI